MLRIIGKLLVFTLSIFAIFLGICAVLGIQIYFPFNVAEGEEIPYHRMQSIRVAVFITFTFYGALYLINSIREVYPCLLYTSPSPRDGLRSRMPSSA